LIYQGTPVAESCPVFSTLKTAAMRGSSPGFGLLVWNQRAPVGNHEAFVVGARSALRPVRPGQHRTIGYHHRGTAVLHVRLLSMDGGNAEGENHH
jgi:hypothetical protein